MHVHAHNALCNFGHNYTTIIGLKNSTYVAVYAFRFNHTRARSIVFTGIATC